MAGTNYCHGRFVRLIGDGAPLPAVVKRVAGACLTASRCTLARRTLRSWGVSVSKIPIAVKPLQLKSAGNGTDQWRFQPEMRKGRCISYQQMI